MIGRVAESFNLVKERQTGVSQLEPIAKLIINKKGFFCTYSMFKFILREVITQVSSLSEVRVVK